MAKSALRGCSKCRCDGIESASSPHRPSGLLYSLHVFMTGARIFRLALALALALLAVGLGGLSVYRKVQAFQPLGFEAVAKGGAFSVVQVYTPKSGLQRGDQILLVNGGEVASRGQLVQRLEERPASELTVMRGEQLQQIRYVRPAVRFDLAYLILAVIGAAYLGVGLFTLVRHAGRQSF